MNIGSALMAVPGIAFLVLIVTFTVAEVRRQMEPKEVMRERRIAELERECGIGQDEIWADFHATERH